MDENKAIQNPENTCFNCLKETIVHKIKIPALGWGSQFDSFSTRIHLCDDCYKLTNSNWWKLKIIKGKDNLNGVCYEYEDEILNFVEQMPLPGQELFYNRYAVGEFTIFHMEAQDWIDYQLGILPHEKYKEYIFAYFKKKLIDLDLNLSAELKSGIRKQERNSDKTK